MTESTVPGLDLPGAIEEAVAAARAEAGAKPISLIAQYPAHLPTVQGDRPQVVRAIAALIRAATAFVEGGEIRVRANLPPVGEPPQTMAEVAGRPEFLAAGGPWAVISVQALQARITKEVLAALLAGEAVIPGKGTEASLAECVETVQASGGGIWLEAQPTGGARFSIALPLRAGSATGAEWSSLRQLVETHLPGSDAPTKTILLLVEDEGRREALADELRLAGYRVISVAAGGNVQPLAHQQVPDLILLDLQARDPNAFEVATVLKQDPKTRVVPLLFLSSVDDPRRDLSLGSVDFVVRPAGTAALISTIQTVLSAGLSPSSRVLVVESADEARETIITMIQAHGYRVTEARSAEEALVLAERTTPSLVLINARLAQERDYWLLRSLRQLPAKMEVIVLADAFSEAEGRAAVRRGASSFSETGKLSDVLSQARKRGR